MSQARARPQGTQLAVALLQHCYNEFTFLSRFLPSVYVAEQPGRRGTPLPW